MATQKQVNTEVGKIYSECIEYISKKVQSSDTFSGLSGNQHAELEALAKKANSQIADLKIGEPLQKIKATNEVRNEIAQMLVSDPKSPYAKYTPQQVNVLAMQSALGGQQEYVGFGKRINDTLLDRTLKVKFLTSFEDSLRESYESLAGRDGARENGARASLITLLNQQQRNEVNESLTSLVDLRADYSDSIFEISETSKCYYNTSDSKLNELGVYVGDRSNPLITLTFIGIAKVGALMVLAYCAKLGVDDLKDTKRLNVFEGEQQAKAVKDNFCAEVSKSLEQFYKAIKDILEQVIVQKLNPTDALLNLALSKGSFEKLKEVESEEYTIPNSIGLFSDGKPATFKYEECIDAQVKEAIGFDVFNLIPSKSEINTTSEDKQKELIQNLIIHFGGMREAYAKAAAFSFAQAEVARKQAGIEDAARRRRAVTHLIEWAAYGAVSVGVIWGLSKVYKSYKSDD